MNKQAMIMAAGLGTRLKPLTDKTPKALIVYRGYPLLYHVLSSLQGHGFRRVVVNVHHFSSQVKDYLSKTSFPGMEVLISDESDKLLDTGGALRAASSFFEDTPVLVHNVDILSGLNLGALYDYHLSKSYIASLAVKERPTSRYLLMNQHRLLCGWMHRDTGERIMARAENSPKPIAFSAVYVIDKSFIELLPDRDIFPVMPEILRIAGDHDIGMFIHEDHWKDMGRLCSFET